MGLYNNTCLRLRAPANKKEQANYKSNGGEAQTHTDEKTAILLLAHSTAPWLVLAELAKDSVPAAFHWTLRTNTIKYGLSQN